MAELVKIMLSQHIGKPAMPLVAPRDKVKKGQLIATCDGLGANIHSSVYGEVVNVSQVAVEILADSYQPDEYVKIKDTLTNLEAIKEAGIVGAGGAGFPTHIKLDVDLHDGCVILNAAECEPALLHNMRVLQENPASIIRGIKYIMEMVGAAKGFIAIKPHNIDALKALTKACDGEENIEIEYLSDRYPSGDERVVLRALLGVELKPGQLPTSEGAVVCNIETAKRITEAIELRKPVITKDFTVGGRLHDTLGTDAIAYLDQPIGMSVGKYIADCGGYVEPCGEIVLGGPFMGKSGTEDAVITKTLSGIFVAMPFPTDTGKFGILACQCGAGEERLTEIVHAMGGTVVSERKCKRILEVDGRDRCEKPGVCPGQAEAVLKLKKGGAEAIIAGACED